MKKAYLLITFGLCATLMAALPVSGQTGNICPSNDPICIKKTATGSLQRSWDWTIIKVADQSALTLSTGQVFDVNYNLELTATPTTSWSVAGQILIRNQTGGDIFVNRVEDSLGVELACRNYAVPGIVPPTVRGSALVCSYTASGMRDAPAVNTVDVYVVEGGVEVLGATATVPILYSDVVETDECADINDTLAGPFGTVCATDSNRTFTFQYFHRIGPYPDCDSFEEVCNVASFETNDTPNTGSDDWCVNVETAPCEGGCTLTPGYWKTHSKYGPAPYDDTWEMLASAGEDGEDQTFFGSSQTWYQVAWTPPKGGSAYYILAHAYIATVLNLLNDSASTPEVVEAMKFAESFFVSHPPSVKPSKSISQMAKMYAGILDDYNNGLFGPGHCSEEKEPN